MTLDQAKSLHEFQDDYDFWTEIRSGVWTDVMVAPHEFLKFSQKMRKLGVDFSVINNDVGAMIDSQKTRKHDRYNGKINFDQYYRHEDVSC